MRHSRSGISDMMPFVAGAALGGVIGAGVALLLAPQSGDETRKQLKKKAGELEQDFGEFKKDVAPKLEKAKKEFSKKLAKHNK